MSQTQYDLPTGYLTQMKAKKRHWAEAMELYRFWNNTPEPHGHWKNRLEPYPNSKMD